MRICIICEGSYPYVTGGVSSWVDMLIRSMPEHEFVLYCIGAEEKNRGAFRYEIPLNVVETREVFLDGILRSRGTFDRKIKITDRQKENVKSLISGGDFDIGEICGLLRSHGAENIADFFMSEAFYGVVVDAYREHYANIPFTDFFWTVRSMLLPLFFVAAGDLPQADVYHSVSAGYAGIVGCVASRMLHRPFLLTEHGIYTREREEEIIKARWVKDYLKDIWIKFFYSLSRCTYGNAARVVTLFRQNAKIEEEIGCPKKKISVVANGIDVSRYASIPERKNGEPVCVGAILRVVPIKDVKTMLQSFSYVAAKVPACRFRIMGSTEEDPEYYAECLELVKELRLENVRFTGAVDVTKYLGQVDVLVLSSISEGQPLALLEGMACRKPIVATNVGDCGELLYDPQDGFGHAGILVPLMDYVGMGEAVVTLCRDAELRGKMGEAGFRRVSAFYTKDRFIRQYKQIYRELERASMWLE